MVTDDVGVAHRQCHLLIPLYLEVLVFFGLLHRNPILCLNFLKLLENLLHLVLLHILLLQILMILNLSCHLFLKYSLVVARGGRMIFFETILVALFSSGRDDVVVCIV